MTKITNNSIFLILLFVVLPYAFSQGEVIYGSFKSYAAQVVSEDYDAIVENSIASDLRSRVEGEPASFEEKFPILHSLPRVLSKRISYHEKIVRQSKGCLTINGLDQGGDPASLNVEYIKEGGRWRLSYAEIAYLESEKEFGSTGKYPVRPE